MKPKIRAAFSVIIGLTLPISCMSLLNPGYNELIAAVNKGDTASVRNLIKDGANVNARDANGLTVLMNAVCCAKKNAEIVILLLDNGAGVNARTADGGLTPLMFAVQNGYPEFITLLLSRGAAVNAETANGSTALSLAEQFGQDEIAEILKRAGGIGMKTGDIPLGQLRSLPQKHREAVLAVNRAWVAGKLSAPAMEFLKLVAESKPDLVPPLSLGDIGGDALQAVLNGKATALTAFLEAWAEYIAMNAAADKLSSERYLSSKEGIERAERLRRSRVAFRAALERAKALDKITLLTEHAILDQAGLPTREQAAEARADQAASRAAEPYFQRGYAAVQKGQYDQAIADLGKAIELYAKSADAYYQRGYAYGLQGLYEKTVPDADKAAALNPEYADAYLLKAVACEQLKRTQDAIRAYRDFIKHAPPKDTSRIENAKKRIHELEKQ